MLNNYLIKVSPRRFHLLPGESCYQEDQMGSVRSVGLLRSRYEGQQDGSRLKVVYSSKFSDPEIARRLMEIAPGRPPIFLQSSATASELRDYCARGEFNPQEHKYLVFWMHTFLNAARLIPIMVNEKAQSFYDLSPIFDTKIPEDNFGVLVDYTDKGPCIDELILPDIGWMPELIEYRSKNRLCHCCGRVSDISKPIRFPWRRLESGVA